MKIIVWVARTIHMAATIAAGYGLLRLGVLIPEEGLDKCFGTTLLFVGAYLLSKGICLFLEK